MLHKIEFNKCFLTVVRGVTLSALYLLVLYSLFSCETQVKAPRELRTDLLRNADYVGQNGFKQHIKLDANVALDSEYELSKIRSKNPLFQWMVDPNSKNSTAYQILVSDDLDSLKLDKGNMWDSGKIESNRFAGLYNGKALNENEVYHWKIRYWENDNSVSQYSKPQTFVTSDDLNSNQFSQEPLRGVRQTADIFKRENGYFIDFKKAAFGKLQLRLKSQKADTISVIVGELKDSAQLKVADLGGNIRYLELNLPIESGDKWYEIEWPEDKKRESNPFMVQIPDYIGEVFPFRYVVLENYNELLETDDAIRTMVHYNFNEDASYFYSSDSILNQVWDLCKYSMKATSFLGYYVDGDRERIPYEADAFINQLSHYAVDAEYSISRGSMKHLLFNPTWPTEWTLYNILMAWYDFLYTGDDRFISEYYEELKIKTLLDLADDSGLISTRTGKQDEYFFNRLHKRNWGNNNLLRDIVDWPQENPPGGYEDLEEYIGDEKEYPGENDGYVYQTYNAVVNALYYRSLTIMGSIAHYLGKTEDVEFFQNQAEIVKAQYLKVFQDNVTGLINDGEQTDHKSQHANMFALAYDLIPEKDQKVVLDFVVSKNMSCSVYGAQILLEGLFDYGGEKHGISLMGATTERSWYNMIRFGSTITMEAWDRRYKPNLDLNHAWGGAPANIIVRKMMGIEPISPGAQKIKIHPKIGELTHAELKTSFISGSVELKCIQTSNSYTLKLKLPGGVKADVMVPANKGAKQLFVNGKAIKKTPLNGVYHLEDFSSKNAVIEVR